MTVYLSTPQVQVEAPCFQSWLVHSILPGGFWKSGNGGYFQRHLGFRLGKFLCRAWKLALGQTTEETSQKNCKNW